MTAKVIRIGDHDPEPVRNDLFMFEMGLVQYQLSELRLLANRFREAVNLVESAVQFNSLTCLQEAVGDFEEITIQTARMQENLEIIATKASRSTQP